MFKIIITLLLLSIPLLADMNLNVGAQNVYSKIKKIDSNNPNKICLYYRNESNKYFMKGNNSNNVTIAWRYLNIANRYADQYNACVFAGNNNRHYQGYKSNRYNGL